MMNQIMNVINLGIVLIDKHYTICEWNRWMEIHSGMKKETLMGTSLFNHYPHLSSGSFIRSCKSVLRFGNFVYYSQKLHGYMFPFPPLGYHAQEFDLMQQSCTLTPFRDEGGNITHIVITVQDVTESVYMEKSMKMLSQYDSLTGIHNRRYLDKRLKEEFIRYKRKQVPFAFIMMDIDDFKHINDTYGHQFGDRILLSLTGTCKDIIRGSDTLARFGGEEFSLILPDANETGAKSFAERARKKIASSMLPAENGDKVSVTVSIGITMTTREIEDIDQLIHQADCAMYESKRQGKNRVTLYSEIPVPKKNPKRNHGQPDF